MQNLHDQLTHLAKMQPRKCQTVSNCIAEISPNTEGRHKSFWLFTHQWTPAWDWLEATVRRWLILEGCEISIDESGDECKVEILLKDVSEVIQAEGDNSTTTLVAGYLKFLETTARATIC